MRDYFGFICTSIVLVFVPLSSSLAKPHTHGGRSHDHSLPAQGVNHKHGNGAIGKYSRASTPSPNNSAGISNKDVIAFTKKYNQAVKPNSFEKNKNLKGKKTINYSDGKYVGQVRNGKAHGQGTFYQKNGNVLSGGFKNGKKHGLITGTFNNGDRFVLNFKNGQRHGIQKLYRKDGSIGVGHFKNGKSISGKKITDKKNVASNQSNQNGGSLNNNISSSSKCVKVGDDGQGRAFKNYCNYPINVYGMWKSAPNIRSINGPNHWPDRKFDFRTRVVQGIKVYLPYSMENPDNNSYFPMAHKFTLHPQKIQVNLKHAKDIIHITCKHAARLKYPAFTSPDFKQYACFDVWPYEEAEVNYGYFD